MCDLWVSSNSSSTYKNWSWKGQTIPARFQICPYTERQPRRSDFWKHQNTVRMKVQFLSPYWLQRMIKGCHGWFKKGWQWKLALSSLNDCYVKSNGKLCQVHQNSSTCNELATVKIAPRSTIHRTNLTILPKITAMNSEWYQNVLHKQYGFEECFSQHDGVPCHMTRATIKWINGWSIHIWGSWPWNSLDLDPIRTYGHF